MNKDGIRRAVVMSLITVCCVMSVNASVWNCRTEVDGVAYRTDYHQEVHRAKDGLERDHSYLLEYEFEYYIQASAERCQAERVGNEFLFYDGSRIPAFEYGAVLVKRNQSRNERLPNFDPSKDEVAKRYPYYTGDVWLQDSVCMQALPNLRKTKYHIVFDMVLDEYSQTYFPEHLNKFNEELTSIRTPRYAVVRKGLFKDCTGLHTARIGAAQCVEERAFENCSRLQTVFFESAPYVETDAFLNCPNIRCVVMNTKLPQAPEESWTYYEDDRNPFDDQVYKQATLYVREDQMEAFRNDKTWGKFMNIRDIEEYLAGVESVNPDTEMRYEIYDMTGVHVRSAVSGQNWREGLPTGVYIVKSSLGTVKKEYIK